MPPHSLRFMTQFQCVGGDCPDSCCANWQIDVDREHFVKIARLLSRTREGETELSRAFYFLDEDKRTPHRYAKMQLTAENGCPFWGADKLCTLQQRFSARALPDVCAHFPRSLSMVEGELELSGQLACPEVARLCIADEHACDLVPVDEVQFARGGVRQRTGLDSADPYYARFLEVRETLFALLSLRQYPLRSRLFFTLCFADRTAEFFHRGTEFFDEGRWAFERRSILDKEILDELHAQLEHSEVPGGMALFVIAQVLAGDMQHRSGGKFREVVGTVLDSYKEELGAADASAEEMWKVFVRRRQLRTAQAGARLDQIFENFCKQYWVREWYVDSVDLYTQLQALLVRVAVLRFLLVSHPSDDLEKTAVDVIYSLSRGVEHHSEFLKLITEGLRTQLPTVMHSASLLLV